MASLQISPPKSAPSSVAELRHFRVIERLIAVVIIMGLGVPPIHFAAAMEPPLLGSIMWNPLPVTPPNPFVWHAPSRTSLLYPFSGNSSRRSPFPAFRVITGNNLPLPADQADPWTPADFAPIPLPDGMPVQGNPAGLAMLENAVGNGTIYGEVSDATTLNPIAGALVEIIGIGRTSETDAQGKYRFDGMPAGTFSLEASQLGYFGDTTVITVIEGSPSEVRFGLKIKPTDDTANVFTLEEESVVGEYQGESSGDLAIDLQLTSSIASGISKDDFTKAGIGDAGDAVAKISGANIVGGRYAVVRGLGDRYSNTLVNGALISSADPTRKAVQLDLFPSDLLESISIFKTFTPELPAEFAGGTVVIKTLQFPEEQILKIEYGQKYNTNLDGDFYTSGDDLGYFGKVDTGLPDSVPQLGQFESGPTRRPPNATNPQGQAAIADATALHLSSSLDPPWARKKFLNRSHSRSGTYLNSPRSLRWVL